MQIGAHISKSGTMDSWVDNAVERGCSAFQVFTRSPRSWFAKDLDLDEAKAYKEKLDASDIDRMATCAHMPYLPNRWAYCPIIKLQRLGQQGGLGM